MLKSHAELRRERDLPIPQKDDSQYKHHDEQVDKERDTRVFASIQVPKTIEENLPFKQKQRVKVMNDATRIDKNRQQNLLNALNLPTKQPFKSQFMNQSKYPIGNDAALAQLARTYLAVTSWWQSLSPATLRLMIRGGLGWGPTGKQFDAEIRSSIARSDRVGAEAILR